MKDFPGIDERAPDAVPGADAGEAFRKLLELMAKLRSPEGCPWDREQTRGNIGRYLIEEAYEVLEAIDGPSPGHLKEELGDLLFQIVFIARIAEEAGEFHMSEVIREIHEKMVRRHPHVFGESRCANTGEVRANWERIKKEVELKGADQSPILDGIPRSLSTLAKAQRITGRASKAGFDWSGADGVLAKVEEELAEFRAALAVNDQKRIQDEAGDLLFTLVNLCRFVRVDAESALRSSLGKFIDRFTRMERELASRGKSLQTSSMKEMDPVWEEVKLRGDRKTA